MFNGGIIINILVVFTGGTIGCAPSEEGKAKDLLKIKKENKTFKDYYLITEYIKRNPETDIKFSVDEPLQTLSENMTVGKWNKLAKCFKALDFSKYDGIIVTHGTDTLAYTASFLGLLLNDIKIPVALVSSNADLYNEKANGHKNFEAAIDFIKDTRYSGVYVFYSYDLIKTHVYLSTRIRQSQPFADTYSDISCKDFGTVENRRFVANKEWEKDVSVKRVQKNILKAFDGIKSKVLMISPYVSIDYSAYSLENISAVLHNTYHSFTFCVDGEENENNSVISLIKRCEEKNIPFYFAPYDSSLTEVYASTQTAIQSTAKFVSDVTAECAYAKLLLAYSLFTSETEIADFIETELFFEKHSR